jgi:hypothetical protein
MNEKQHVVRNQPSERKHFHREEVGRHQYRHVSTDKVFPTRCLLPFGSRWNIMAAENIAHRLIRELEAKSGQPRTPIIALTANAVLIGVNWAADSTPDGLGSGTLGPVGVSLVSTNGGVNGGDTFSATWTTNAGTNDVPGIAALVTVAVKVSNSPSQMV